MIQWLITLALAGLVVAYTILGRVSDYAGTRPHWLPSFALGGVSMSELVLVLAGAGILGVVVGLVPLVRWFSFHLRFNAAMIAVALAAIKVGLI